jgi:twitching motility protein PilI
MTAGQSAGAALFDLIAGMDAHFRALATRLPEQMSPSERWSGVLFRVGELRLFAPVGEVAEVLTLPEDLTPVPGVEPWVLGVANHRGTLLPVFDLVVLMQGGQPVRQAANRVLVVHQDELPCGLVVDEVMGIRHFACRQRLAPIPAELGVMAAFAESAYPVGGAAVPVIALERLIADPLMCQVIHP